MKSILKLFCIVVAFSIIFFLLRFHGNYLGYNVDTLITDLGGLTYLYSTVGTIFAVFSAFLILSESQDWNTLVNSSKNEIRYLNEILLWSSSFSSQINNEVAELSKRYLKEVVGSEWTKLSNGQEDSDTAKILDEFHKVIARVSKDNQQFSSVLFLSFNNFLSNRSIRIDYSYEPLAKILKMTVIFVAVVLIILSLLIGVHNLWLDYLFMLSIVTLVSVILLVIDDLDNPLKPGDWYLSSEEYNKLLISIVSSR